jgi:signal transduction histidine kinase
MRTRTFVALAAAAVLIALINVGVLVLAPGQRGTVIIDDFSECLTPLGAAGLCLATAFRSHGRARQAWGLIGISAACWGLGQVYWTYEEVFLQADAANLFPSYADLGFLTSVPFAVVGLLRLSEGATSLAVRVRSLLDGMVIAGALLFISWDLVLGPVYADSPTDLLAKSVGLAYPASDIAMVTIILLTIMRLRVGRRVPLALLGGGLLLTALADSAFAYLTTVQGFGSSNIIDIGWTLGYALIGLAAIGSLESATGVGTAETRMPHWNLMLPYWTVGAAGMLAVITEFTLGSLNAVLEWDLLFIITVVLVRQFLFLGETAALNTEVANKNEDLDRQVRERTRALTQSLEELYQTDDERRQLVLRLVTLQEEERRHIADVIHDDMLQSMIGAKMRTFLLQDAAGANAEATASIESAIDRAIVRMRSLMTDLRPQILDLGLLPTLEQSIGEFNEAGDLTVTLENHLADDPSSLVGTSLYRIVREALNNAHKHAPGATVTVSLSGGVAEGFRLRIHDDGPGFTPQSNGKSPMGHRGLSSISERAEALGGWARLATALGEGTTIDVWLPNRLEVVPRMPAA